MDAERLWKEYIALPAEAQTQVIDFLAFLRARHADKRKLKDQWQIDWDSDPFIGMWRGRDDMAQSSRWVRNLRERDWSRNCD